MAAAITNQRQKPLRQTSHADTFTACCVLLRTPSLTAMPTHSQPAVSCCVPPQAHCDQPQLATPLLPAFCCPPWKGAIVALTVALSTVVAQPTPTSHWPETTVGCPKQTKQTLRQPPTHMHSQPASCPHCCPPPLAMPQLHACQMQHCGTSSTSSRATATHTTNASSQPRNQKQLWAKTNEATTAAPTLTPMQTHSQPAVSCCATPQPHCQPWPAMPLLDPFQWQNCGAHCGTVSSSVQPSPTGH
jgi:hypothetical protein